MNECTICEQPITGFRDDASVREASISGMCQDCQDGYFGVEDKVAGYDDVQPVDVEGRTELDWARMGCPDCSDGYCEVHDTGTDTDQKEGSKLPGWIQDAQSELG